MADLERILRDHLKEAQKTYDTHLKNKKSFNGSFLVGKYQALIEVMQDFENEKTKAKKTRR